jgi:TolA-binding protein
LSEGAKGDFGRKADVLTVLINNYPKSGYIDDALFELAMAYVLRNQETQALTWFDRLIRDFPNSAKSTQAWLRKGFIYYNRDDNNRAIDAFKHIVEKHPGTQESQEALAALKNIYVETGKVEEYYAYARGLSFAEVDVTEEDSLNYLAAENLYTQSRYEQSSTAFRKYIEKFPSGAYVTNATYYEAECLIQIKNPSAALEGYKKVAERPHSRFTEPALAKAASMEFSARNFTAALPLYEHLETVAEDQDNLMASLIGQMRCHLKEKNYPSAGRVALKLLGQDGIPKDVANESHYALGHKYLAEDNLIEAASEFRQISKLKGTEIGADASYQLAWIAYQTEKLVEAEEQAYALAENFPAFDYWVAKGFILLSDVFVKNGNTFQAKETLQSVIENYSGPELGEIARQKLAVLESN